MHGSISAWMHCNRSPMQCNFSQKTLSVPVHVWRDITPRLEKQQLRFLCFPRRLLLLIDWVTVHQDLLNCFQDIEPKRFCRKLLFHKVQRDITKIIWIRVTVLVLCTLSYDICIKFHQNILNGFQVVERTLFCNRNGYIQTFNIKEHFCPKVNQACGRFSSNI